MSNNKIVSRDDWLEARKALLASEKEFTRLRDELTKQRRQLPWVEISKDYEGIDIHLAHRDTTLLAISNTSVQKIEEYRKRMGWTVKWVSSLGSDFNRDFHVTFTQDEMDNGEMYYNYHMTKFPSSEGPGISVLYRDDSGDIYHTYSCYARGLDMLNGAYHMLDLTPIGRNETNKGNMYWLRRRDQYDD